MYAHILLNKTLVGGQNPKFEELTFSQMMAWELEIISREKIKKEEREIRLHIVKELAYLSDTLSIEKDF